MLLFSFQDGYLNEFLAISVFFILLFLVNQIDKAVFVDVVRFYKYAVLFTAIGVVFQFVVHRVFGVELFRYQLFGGNRNAYSFIWEDYSFISLFIASSIPLFFEKKIDFKFSFVTIFLLSSSIITSARTGVVAFILFVALYVGYEIIESFSTGRIKKSSLVIFLSLFFCRLL